MKNYDLLLTCTACGYNGPTNCDEDGQITAHCDNCGYTWVLKAAEKKWMTDEEISALIGIEWQEDLDVSSEFYKQTKDVFKKSMSGKEYMLFDANEWLQQNGKALRVYDVRDNASGDFLDWQVELLS